MEVHSYLPPPKLIQQVALMVVCLSGLKFKTDVFYESRFL